MSWPYAGISPRRVQGFIEELRTLCDDGDVQITELEEWIQRVRDGQALARERIAEYEQALAHLEAPPEEPEPLSAGEPEVVTVTRDPGLPSQHSVRLLRWPDGREENLSEASRSQPS